MGEAENMASCMGRDCIVVGFAVPVMGSKSIAISIFGVTYAVDGSTPTDVLDITTGENGLMADRWS